MLADGSRYYCVIIVPIIWNIAANNNLLRTCIRCIRYYPNVVTSYNNIPSRFRIMRLQGIPIYRCTCTLLTRQPDGYVALKYLCFVRNILMSVAGKIGVKISCRTLGTVPHKHYYKLCIYELRGV